MEVKGQSQVYPSVTLHFTGAYQSPTCLCLLATGVPEEHFHDQLFDFLFEFLFDWVISPGPSSQAYTEILASKKGKKKFLPVGLSESLEVMLMGIRSYSTKCSVAFLISARQ